MKLAIEHLIPPEGRSFRCLNRAELESPAKWHSHPELELTYVERGSGTRLVGDHIGVDHDLVLLGSDLPHDWMSDAFAGQKYDRHPAYVAQFGLDFLGESFFDAPELHRIKYTLQVSHRGIWFPPEVAVEIGNRLQGMLSQPPDVQLLSTCNEGALLASEGYSPLRSEGGRQRLASICKLIQERLQDPDLNQRTLAAAAHMNASAFSRFFKRATGCSVSHYIHQLRIGAACRLLLETDLPIINIAQEVGFGNLSNFNRRFLALRGVTPRAFRIAAGTQAWER